MANYNSKHTGSQIDSAVTRALAGGAIDQAIAKKMDATESTDYPGCYYRMFNNVKEWLNPPMVVGVEYRTTEKFEGKPVYCQLVYFTGVVDGGTVTVNVPKVATVLRFFGSRSGVPLPFISEKGLSNAWTNYFSVNRFTDKITIIMNAGSSVPSGSRFYCALYYTKNA